MRAQALVALVEGGDERGASELLQSGANMQPVHARRLAKVLATRPEEQHLASPEALMAHVRRQGGAIPAANVHLNSDTSSTPTRLPPMQTHHELPAANQVLQTSAVPATVAGAAQQGAQVVESLALKAGGNSSEVANEMSEVKAVTPSSVAKLESLPGSQPTEMRLPPLPPLPSGGRSGRPRVRPGAVLDL
eukprot:SAG31_NODE_489_length_14938_cov_5.644113_15_plen_191_part_00